MENKVLSKTLRTMAREQGLCDQWFHDWQDDTDIDELLDKYVAGFDFCVKNDYPSLDFIRKNFNIEDLHRHHIYIDETVDIRDADNGFWIFLGECRGNVRFEGFKAATVYVRHNSRMYVKATDGAIVFITCFDSSSCSSRADNYSKIRKYNRKSE